MVLCHVMFSEDKLEIKKYLLSIKHVFVLYMNIYFKDRLIFGNNMFLIVHCTIPKLIS